MKNRKLNILLLIVFLTGLSLLLYPTVSDYWNSLHQSRAIAEYAEAVSQLDDEVYEREWARAQEYNAALPRDATRYLPGDEQHEQYMAALNISGGGAMGYIEIPAIGVSLPVRHGVEDSTLQTAIGHIEGTSLPVGGEGSHCALSGHRGLPSARLFTDLDQLREGDVFMLRILDEVLTYEVDQIRIVEPDDMSLLEFVEGEDLCTLVTCTPYGVNSHRLLVRGHRIENQESASTIRVTADAIQIEPVIVAPLVAVPMLLLLLVWLLISTRKRKPAKDKRKNE